MLIDINQPATLLLDGQPTRWYVIDDDTGLKVTKVVCCDTDTGVLTRFLTDSGGNFLLNAKRDAARKITISGMFRVGTHK